MSILIADNEELRKECLKIRYEVFVDEQKVPEELEEEYEDVSTCFLIKNSDNKYVGTLRYRLIDDNTAKIERFAILKNFRNQQLGKKLFSYLIKYLKENSDYNIVLNAQKYLIKYYEKFGFETIGDIFFEANIEHVKMIIKK